MRCNMSNKQGLRRLCAQPHVSLFIVQERRFEALAALSTLQRYLFLFIYSSSAIHLSIVFVSLLKFIPNLMTFCPSALKGAA